MKGQGIFGCMGIDVDQLLEISFLPVPQSSASQQQCCQPTAAHCSVIKAADFILQLPSDRWLLLVAVIYLGT